MSAPIDWREWFEAFWRAAKVMRQMEMRDVKGRPMWPKMAKVAEQCAAECREAELTNGP